MQLVDMVGLKFGKWTVLRKGKLGKNNCIYWWCRCECGREKEVQGANLRSGQSRGCRKCASAELFKERFPDGGGMRSGYRTPREDLTGRVFSYLTVLERADNIGTHPAWLVKCVCGKEKVLREQAFTSLRTKSCGCKQQEGQIKAHTRHGMAHSEEYGIWQSMKKRCYLKSHNAYDNYGGRGIKMCEQWKNSFEAFFKDVGSRPSPYHQLHRIYNNGNYEPGNVEWTTRTDNMRSRRITRYIDIGGNKIPLNTFCESIGISLKAVAHHLDKGRTIAEAIAIIRPVVS